ncbi:uncharacterized protein LOC132721559 [Ruditapes philippinarum]|uniref:uncharacterized protein LOC132721559 n=1 Tax=Ruditapes philippinarum TaxID=129788 RepID=UPI00295B23E1|nr:uncharacterized protein LOC132721559 [Ruditapes philippinarum]
MAELSGVVNIERFTTEIQSLPIGNDIRVELNSCLQNITGLNLSDVGNTNERNNPLSRYDDVIILLNKFAKAAVDALGACELLPFPLGIICKVITEVVGFMFSKDIASVVINRFTAIIEADLIAKYRATCTKLALCITYMQGLPSLDGLQPPSEKFHHLQLLASDFPIQTGLDEVLFLGEKIKQMVRTADVKKANTLFELIQLYCCLATYWELFLLYRFAIQSSFSVDAGSVSSVLSAQKTNDRDVLRFLYKPTTRSVRLFRCCFLDNWLILKQFLDRHRLVTDDLSELSGRKFKIKSMRFETKYLRPCTLLLFREHHFLLRDDSNDAAVHIEFRADPYNRNVFTLWSHCYRRPRQVYCDNLHQLSISEGVPPAGSDLWYILRVHPETPMESTCYMIWLATDHQLCLYAYWNGHVDLTSTTNPGRDKFWIFERVPE